MTVAFSGVREPTQLSPTLGPRHSAVEVRVGPSFEPDDAAIWLHLSGRLDAAAEAALEASLTGWSEGVAGMGDLRELSPTVRVYPDGCGGHWRRYRVDFGAWQGDRPVVWRALARHLKTCAVLEAVIESDRPVGWSIPDRYGLSDYNSVLVDRRTLKQITERITTIAPVIELVPTIVDPAAVVELELADKPEDLERAILAVLAVDPIARNNAAVRELARLVGRRMFDVACALDVLRDDGLIDDDGDRYAIINSIWILPAGRQLVG